MKHNNVAEIITEAVEATNRRILIKSDIGTYLHWNQELKLPNEIKNLRWDRNFLKGKKEVKDQVYGMPM
jgi:hypothetical protein